MMVIIGAIIVIGVIYLLLKRHESRMVLIAAGILMAVIAGKPMAALDAFAKSMTNAGLITSVCSCMGFAMVMKYTGCDKHLVVAIGKVLKKWALCSYLVLLLRLLSLISQFQARQAAVLLSGLFYSYSDVCRYPSGDGGSCCKIRYLWEYAESRSGT